MGSPAPSRQVDPISDCLCPVVHGARLYSVLLNGSPRDCNLCERFFVNVWVNDRGCLVLGE